MKPLHDAKGNSNPNTYPSWGSDSPMMFNSDVSLPKDDKTTMQGKQITAEQLKGLWAQTNANYATKEGRGSKAWGARQGK